MAHAVITVRMPAELHRILKEQAHAERTSLNQLCVDRLRGVRLTEDGLVDVERQLEKLREKQANESGFTV
jgi:hypothetical protein